MVLAERRSLHVERFKKIVGGVTDWRVRFEKVSPFQVSNERVRANNNLVGLIIDDPVRKVATIIHTRRVITQEDIVHELVHLAHPEWQIHEDVNIETRRIMNLKRGKI